MPCSIERSRSGNGAHVWIFFDSPVLAVKARKLGNAILTEAMNRDGKIGFKSYDRFFPNQDTLPEIVRLLSTRRDGYTRSEITNELKIADNGHLSDMLDDLEHCDSIRRYNE